MNNCLIRFFILVCLAGFNTLAWSQGQSQFDLTIQNWTTDRGAKAYFVASTELPMVDIRIVFDAGAARDGEHLGIAAMTSALLEEGTHSQSANQIAEAFENLGAQFSASAYRDMSVVHLRSLSDPEILHEAIGLLAEVIAQPRFEDAAIARVRTQMETALAHERQTPSAIASKHFYEALYQGHPYANPTLGTPDSLKNINQYNLIQFHKRYFVTKNMIIAMVGDIDQAHAQKIAHALSRILPVGEQPAPLPEVTLREGPESIDIPFPSSQTHIILGSHGVAQGNPDYFSLYVANHILGGSGLVSLLNETLREEKGLTYGASSMFIPMKQSGPFIVNVQSRNEKAQEALNDAIKLIHQYFDTGPSEAQLKMTKGNILGSFSLRTASNQAIVGQVAAIGFYDLPLDYLNTFHDHVKRVTRDDIQRALKKHIQTEDFITIKVGNGHANQQQSG